MELFQVNYSGIPPNITNFTFSNYFVEHTNQTQAVRISISLFLQYHWILDESVLYLGESVGQAKYKQDRSNVQ